MSIEYFKGPFRRVKKYQIGRIDRMGYFSPRKLIATMQNRLVYGSRPRKLIIVYESLKEVFQLDPKLGDMINFNPFL